MTVGASTTNLHDGRTVLWALAQLIHKIAEANSCHLWVIAICPVGKREKHGSCPNVKQLMVCWRVFVMKGLSRTNGISAMAGRNRETRDQLRLQAGTHGD